MPAARTAPVGYSAAQIGLHWGTALLVPLAWLTHDGAEDAFDAMRDGAAAALPLHAWLGLAVLALTLVRLALRLTRGAPPPPAADPQPQRLAAAWVHRLIYALLLLVPAGGLAMWLTAERTPHGLMANLLMVLALGHAAVALFHHYVRRDGLILRMMRAERG